MIKLFCAAGLALALLGASPAPAPFAAPPALPSKPLHARYSVEVNRLGQVVRVEHGTLSGNQAFDTMTLGNAMQMWIRRANGTATAGLYAVRYDYDARTKKLLRVPSLISAGGTWAGKPGAATLIVKEAKRQTIEAYTRLRAEQQKADRERAKHLPDINAAVKRAVASPSPKP
ncbi:MAG: hypothetical protein ABR508_02145 [Candidatus Baltobacteraceae bacterium]